ncbi:MAG TPA: VIT domain-containing protein [Thermoanaerobaculia bacterium]|nr:VIT domain-containing protein [Thermoanaerobaculia bacterium]
MPRWFASLCLALLASPLFAAAPKLTVQSDDGNLALALSSVQIRVTVRGHLARTEYELTYRSELDRTTGGDFEFPLPPDAEVSDLGLWFDGVLRHGVAVERVLAREAYEETIHRSVDPALVEWNAGRSFHLNVFPIPPHGEKKVFVAYDQELTNEDYTLDVSYRASVPKFDVKIDADGATALEENGTIRIPRDPRELALTAKSAEDGMWYASAGVDFTPDAREATPASHVVILYDTSASSVQQNSAILRRFLGAFLTKQQAWSTAEVIPFHVDVDEPRKIANAGTPAAARELSSILDELQPLGATNLLAVTSRLPKIAAALPPTTRIVLVTDGLTSLGDSHAIAAAITKLSSLGRPLLVVHATKTANDQLLANAARATGGTVLDLLRVDTDAAVEEAMHIPATARLSGSEIAPSTISAARPMRIAVASRAKQPITVLPLLGRELPVRELTGATEASMIRRAWARARLRELMNDGASDDDLIAHGRAFNQLTPRTSLLVLENWWDYERYDIPMPPDVVAAKKRYQEDVERQRNWTPPPLPPPVISHDGWMIKGRVLDNSGFELPGVTVILMDGDTGLCATVTDVNGRYALGTAVMPQNPRVVADLPGFNTATRNVPNTTPSGATLDISISVAAVSESITVTAEAPAVQPMSSVATSATPSLRTGSVTTDDLLSILATETPTDDPDLQEEALKHRRELRAGVLAKLSAIGSTAERLRYYLSARALLGGDKGFHVFAAQAFREHSPEVAARVLSDLAESRPDDAPLLRILARVLDGWGEESLARLLLERAIEVSPTEPQSWRELILLEARHGRGARVNALAKRLHAGKKTDWMEAVYEQTDEALARWEKASFLDRQRGVELRADPRNDLTIELMWDSGWCYVDEHIHEPNGEVVKWDHDTSANGATFTGGYTFGYGPEIYTLQHAPKGQYKVMLDYYSQDGTDVSLEALAHVIVNNRGERSDYFFVLSEAKENLLLTTVDVK